MKPVLQLRLEDGDDIVIVKACNPYSTSSNRSRVMDTSSNSNNDDGNCSDDDYLMNESLSNVRAAVKSASIYPNSSQLVKTESDDRKPRIASRPPSAFCLFFRDYEKILKTNRPNVTMAELQKLAMQNWESMDAHSKQRYIEENGRLKEEYDRSLAHIEGNASGKSGMPARTCRGFGCSKPAVENKLWDRDFCGAQCVVNFCRDVFTQWVDENKKRPAP